MTASSITVPDAHRAVPAVPDAQRALDRISDDALSDDSSISGAYVVCAGFGVACVIAGMIIADAVKSLSGGPGPSGRMREPG
jgi:hypothetical protein